MKNKIFNVDFIRIQGISGVFLLLIFLSINRIDAATYYSRATGNWNTNTTWSLSSGGSAVGSGIYPVAGDIVYIQNNRTVTVNAAAACADVNIATGSALTINGFNFTSSGTTTVSGTLTHTSTTATKTFNNVVISGGTWTNNASESYTIANLTLSGSTINGTGTGVFNITGALNVTTGTNTMNALTMTVGGTTTVQGTLVFASTTGNKTFAGVVLSGGTWTSNAAETYPCANLTLAGGTINGSTTGTFTVSGNLAVTAGSVNNLYAFNLTVNGTTTVDGSAVFLSATGTKTFVGLTTVSSTGTWDNDNVVEPINFRGGLTNNGVFFAGTSVYTFNTNNQSINGTLTIPNLTVSGVTVTNNGNLTVSTALSGNGGQTTLTNAATGTLNIGGTSTINTLIASTIGNTVNYNGASQTVKATTYNNLTLSGSGTKTNTGTTVTGVLSIEGTAAPSTAPTWSGTAYTLQYKTTDAHTAGTEWISPFAGSGGVIIANTAGSVTMNSAEVMGTSIPLTINSGATLATGNFQLTLGGNFINNGGTFTAGSSPIIITGTATQNIAGFSTTGAISSTKTGGIATFVGNVNAGSLTMNGLGGTLNLGSGLTHTISGIWTRTNGTLDGGSSVIKFGSSVSGNGGAFTANTGTVEWNAIGTQTIPALAYYNLTLSGSGSKTLSTGTTIQNNFATAGTTTTTAVEAMTVGGNFTIGTGTSFSASTFTHNIAGNWSNTGTFNANTSTINLNGTTQSITGATSFNNLTLGGSATKNFTNATTTTGSFTINSGVIANLGTGLTHSANTLSIAGSGQPAGSWGGTGSAATFINASYFAPASGTLNITSATCVAGSWTGLVSTDWNTATNWCDGVVPTSSTNVIINSGGNQPVINAASFCNNITVNAGASLTIAGTNSLTINGSWTNSGTFTANSGTVIYNGTSQTVVPVNYYHLTLSGSGTKTLQSATTTIGGDLTLSGTVSSTAVVGLTINGNMTIGTGTTFIAGAFTHNVKGNWSNGGTFTATGSTINLNGDVATTISASNFNNISISGLGTKTATGTLSIAGNFNLSSGGLAFNNATSNAISIAGNYTQSGGIFDFNSNATGSSTMTLNGNFTQTSAAGSMTTSGAGAPNGIITFNGSGTQTISTSTPGSCIWVKYIIPVGKNVQLLSNFTLNSADFATQSPFQGEINVSGTFDFGTYVVSQVDGVPGTALFTLNSGANLITSNATGLTGSISATNMTTNLSSAANYEFKGASTGTFTTTPTANTVNNLTFSGIGTTTLGSDFTTNGALTVNSAVNLSMSTYLLTLNGNFINNGTASGTTGGVTIGGTGTQSIGSFTTTGTVSMIKTGGVATLTGNIIGAGLTINGLGGTLNLGSGLTHTISGAWTRTNGTVNGGSSTLNIGGNVTNTAGIFTASTGTVNYTGAAQTIADVNYYNLTFSGSGIKTMGTNTTTIGSNLTLSGTVSVTPAVALTISGNLSIGSGTTFGAGSFTHNIAGNFTNSGTFTQGTSTINLNGTTQSLSGATTFNNLTLAGSGTKTFANNTTTNGNFSLASGVVANLGNGLSHTTSNLYLGGTQQSSSTWGGTGSVADNINTTYFAVSTGILSNLKNWTGSTSTDWNVATNWSDGVIPTSNDNVIIPNVTNKPTIGAAASCKNITINASSSVSITGTNSLTVTGNWTNSGTFTSNSSTVLFTGGAQTISGANTFNNLTAGGTGLKTFSTTPTVNGILSMEGTGTVSAAPTYGTAATLRYNTTTARTAGSEWITPFVATGGVIIGSTGVISLNSAEVINAPLTINSGSTLNTTSANNYALTFGGNFTNNGTLTANASPITITGTATQSIAGFTTTGAVSSTKTGGIATLSGNVSAGSLTINGAGGTLNLGTSLSHTITGDILITTGILDACSSIITTSGNWTNNTWSSFTPGSSTVYMTGTAKAIGGIAPTTFNNLTVSSGSTTLNGNGNIAGNLTINSSATLTNSSTYTLSVTGTTTISGTYTDGSTGTKSFTGDISINSGGVWNETNSAAYNIAGSLTNNGTSFTANTGNHTFSGSSNFFSGSTISTIPYLTLSGSYTNNGTLTVGTTFGGTGNLINNGTLNIGGTAWTVNITASAIGNTINYTGSTAQTIRGITYYNLGLSGVGTKTFPSAISINNNISLASGTTADLGSNLVHTANVLNLNGVAQSSSSFGGTGSLASTINPTYFVANTGVLSTANNWTGATSADWNTATNWSKGTVPTASDAAFVPNVTNKPIINSSAVCSSLTVFTGSAVTINGSNTLTVSGNIVNAGTITSNSGTISLTGTFTNTGTFNSNTGTVNYNGAAQTVAGVNYYHLALSGSGAKTLQSGTTTIGGNLTLSGTTSTTTVAGLSINGNLIIGDGTTFNAAAYNLTVTGTTTVGGGTSGILNITGINTKTFTGDVILSSGSTWNESAASDVIFGGNLSNNASTFTLSTGNHTFSGSSNLFSGSTITSIPYLTLSGSYTNNGTLTVGTTFGGTGNIINNGTLNIGGTSWSINLTATSIGNTVNYTGSSAQTIRGITYYNLGLSGGGTKTFPSSISINNNISLASGTAADLGSSLVHTANVLNLNGIAQSSSTYGGTGSIATTINTTYFVANTGILSTANNWTGATNTDWGTTTNWSKGTVPTISDAVFIPNVTNKPVIGATSNCNNITINASSSVSITGTNSLTVSGNWTNNGTFTANSSTVLFTGGAQTISGTNTFNNLTVGGTGLKTFSTTPTVNGILSMEGTGTVSVAPTYGAAATLQYNTTTARTAGSEWISPFTATGGVIIGSTGAVSLNSAEVINAPLTINSGSTLNTTSANNYALTFGGNFTNSGTLTANASAITITGTATQSIAGFTTTGGITCDKTAGVATLTGNVNAGSLANTGLGGTLNLGSGLTHTISGAWTRTTGTVDGGSSTLNIGGSVTNTAGTFTASTSTVNYTGAAQTIANTNYYNLTLSGSGVKTLSASTTTIGGSLLLSGTALATIAANLSIAGNLNIGTGTSLDLASFTANRATTGGTLTIGGTLLLNASNFPSNYSTVSTSGSTVNYNGAAQTVYATNYNNLTLSGSGAKTLQSGTTAISGSLLLSGTASTTAVTGLTIGVDLNIGAGTTFSAGSFTHNIAGNFTNSGTFTPTTSTINLNGTTQNISGANTFNNLTLAGSGTKTFANNTITSGNFSIGSGVVANLGTGLTHTAGSLYFAGVKQTSSSWGGTGSSAINLNTTYFAASTGIINTYKNWTGATSTDWSVATNWSDGVVPTSTDDVIIPNVTNKPVIGAAASCNNITINASSSVSIIGTNTLTVSGNWTNNGTFTANSSTVLFTGGAQTISGTNTFNNLTAGGTGLKTFSTTPTVNGILSMEGTGTVSAAPTYGASATLQYNTTTARSVGSEWISPFTATGGVIIGSTGAVSLNSAEVINAPLSINSGATLNTNSTNNYALTFGGNFTNSGTLTANASAITITGTGTQSIAGFTTTGGVTCSKSAGVATLTGNINAATLTNSTAGGTLNLGVGLTHTISGAWTRTAGTVDGGSSSLNIGGSVTNTAGTFTASTSTVNYTGAAQTIADVNYYNLTFSGSAAKTMGANTTTVGGNLTLSGTASATAVTALTIAGNLAIGSGTTFAAGSFTHNIAGNFTNSGTFTQGTSTINLNGTTQSISGASTFNNLTLAGSGTKTFANNTTSNGNFSIASGVVANLGNGLSHTASNLYLGGTQQSSSIWGGIGSVADNINTTYFGASTGILSNIKNWTGTTSTDWNIASNWSDGRIPTSNDNVIIPNVTNKPTIGAAASCKNITINASSSVTITGTNTLTIAGNWTNNGTFTANSSTVLFTGATQTISGTNTFNNLTAGGTGLKTFSTTPTVNGILSMEGTGTVSVAPTYGAAATLQYNTTAARTAGSEWISPFTAIGGVIIGSTGAISLNSAEVINAPLTINSGSTLNTTSANNYALTFGGNFTNSGTLTANASAITITGTSTQSIAGFTTTGSLTCDKTAGVATLTGNVNAGSLANTGLGGTLNLGSGLTHTISGAWTRTNGTVNGGSSTLNVGGNVTNTAGTFTASTSTVNYTGAAQTIADVNYYNLTLSGSGTKTLSASTTTIGGSLLLSGTVSTTAVAGLTIGVDLNIGAGTTFSAGSFTHNIAGNFTNSGTFTPTTSTINLNGTTQSLSGANTFNNLTLAGSGTKTFANNTITSGNFSIGSGVVANLGTGLTHTAGSLYFAGVKQTSSSWGGTGSSAINLNTTYFAASTGIINTYKNWTGATSTDWSVATNWSDGVVPTSTDDVIIPNVTNKPVIGAAAICNNITINASSSVSITGTNSLTVTGNWTNSGTFTANSSTVLFTGGAQTIGGTTATIFNNLTVGGTGLKTFSTVPTVNGILSMEGTGTVSAAPTYSAAATLQYNTTTARSAGSEWISPFTATGGVIIGSTGAVSLNSAEVINAPLTINSGATLNTTSANNYALTFGGNFTNNGTLTANASAITITGTGTQSIAGFTTTGGVTCSKSAGVATLTGNVNAATLTNSTAGGTLNLGTGLTHTISGAWTRTAGTVDGGSSTLNIGGTVTNTAGTFTASTSTVNYTGAAQTIADVNYNNLTFSGSAAKTMGANTTTVGGNLTLSGTVSVTPAVALTISGNLSIGSGTTFAAGSFTHNIAGNFTNSGTFIQGTSTINLNGTTQSISGASTFNNLTLAGSGTKTFANNTTTNGNFSLASGVVANLGTGLTHTASNLYLGGTQQSSSTWGGTGSVADNINTTYFGASTGILSNIKNWTGTTSTDWNIASNWSDGRIPTSNDNVIIPNVTNKPTIGAAASCKNITINASSSVSITGTNTLTIAGNWTNNGTFTANSSTVLFTGATQTISGTNTFNNLTVGGTGLKTFSTTPTVNGILSMEGTGTVSVAPTYGAAATLQYNTTTARTAGSEWISPFTATGGVIIGSTGAISLNSAEVINAPLTINSGSTLNTTSANNYALTFGGNFTNSGTLTANASAITITGTGTQSIAGFTTTGGITCDKTAGVATLTGNVNAGSLANTGLGGTLNLGSGLTHTISGAWTRTNGTVNGGSSTLNIGGSVTNTAGTFTASTGTVNYTGAAQTIADVNYYNLTFSGSGIKTMGTNTTTIGGNLTLNGTASATTAAALAVTGNLTVGSGTTFATGATNSWTLGITGTTSVTGTLTLANTGAKTFTGDVTLNSGAIWNETGVAAIGFGGNFTNNATTFTANTGTHTFSGTTKTHSGATTTSIPIVTFTGSYTNSGILTSATLLTVTGATVTLTNNGIISASTALSGTGGLVQGTNGILNIGGTSGITTLTATTIGNTVNYNGAAQTVKTGNYYNLTLSGSGTKTLLTGTTLIGGNFTLSGTASTTGVVGLTVNGDLTIGTGTTLNSGAFIHTIDGNWINNGGTFTAGTGTVTLTGSGKTIGGTTSTTFYNLTINSGGTTLNSNETVSNILTLRSGILTTSSSSLLSISNTATTAISGGSSTSFINGPLNWTLPSNLVTGSTYIFPVGKGSTYLPFSLVDPTTGSGIVTAKVEAFNTNSAGTHDATVSAISNTEYWSLTTSGNFTNSTISVSRPTNIAPLDVIAGNTTAANGNYTNLLGTVINKDLINSAQIGSNRFFCLAQGVSTITLSTTTLTGFSYPYSTGPSAEQSFTVRGNSLIANIALTPDSIYEISTGSGASFVPTSQINLSISSGAVPVSTIYVRLKAGLNIGTYNSILIKATSGGASSKTVSCSGTVSSAPSTTLSPTSLSGFTYIYTKGPTTEQSFTVSGSNLAGNVVVTPPSDYQISTTSGTGYQSTAITLTPTNGVLSNTTIYVIMPSGLGVGSHNQNITVTTLGAITKNIAISGTVTAAPTLTTSISYLGGFIYRSNTGPSGEQSFNLIGSNLSTSLRNDTIIAPTNFEISTTSGTGFTNQIILTRATGVSTQSKTIYVRMITGLAVGSYGPANVILKSSNAIVKTVALVGSVVSSATVLVSSNTLTGFGYMQTAGPSSDQQFTVSGAYLTSTITVTPPANYEITTTSGSGYQTTPITLNLTSGRVNPMLIYVRLKAGLTAGNYTGVNITVASSGAISKNVALVGTVFVSPLVTAGGGGAYCEGSTINLTSAGADIQNRYWQGPNSFYSTSQNPSISSATTAMSGTYTVTGNVVVGGNLITNWDFEMGNIAFGSGYGYVDTTNTQALYPESKYTVVKLPHSVHPNFSTYPDHTTRSGLQMVVNGAPIAGVVVWSQSVPVIPGATYEFTYWEQTVNLPENPKNASQLQLYVNGVAAGPIYTAPLVNNQWTQFLYNAAAGTNNVLNLELINQNTVASGNDFALDDIVFRQILPATSTVDVTVNPILPVSVSVAASANPVYKNTPVTFTATPTNGGTTPTYQWQVNGTNVGTSSTTYTYTPNNGDVVKCILTSSLTCVSNNPANASVVMVVNTRSNYWYGYIDTDWAKPRNWTGNFVPLPGDDVEYATVANTDSVAKNDLWLDKNRTIGSLINATTKALVIPATKGLEINNYAITDGNTNRIQIKTSSTLSNGSIHFNQPTLNNSVNATVEMYSRASWDLSQPINNKYKWQYFGIPIRTVKAQPTFNGSYVRKWVESGNSITNHWIQLANDSVLKPFYGYEICQEAPTTIVFRGTLETRDFSSGQMPFTTTALYPGQNVYANSYTAGISIKNLDYGSSTEATAYLYNTGTFNEWIPNSQFSGLSSGQYIAVPKNLTGLLGLPEQVASMQSILIKAQSNSSNATFGIRYLNTVVDFDSAIHRVRGINNNPFENTDKVATIIDVTGNKTADRVWLVSEPTCSKNFDNGWDGYKFIGSAISPQLYAIEPDGKYQVDAINDINDTELGFIVGQDSEYTLTFTHSNIKSKYAGIYLVDLLENKTIDVTESGTKYEFSATSSTQVEKRFKVVARHYEENAPDAESKIKVFSSNGNIFIQNLDNSSIADVMIYDIAGHYLQKIRLTPNAIITLSQIVPGAYIAKVVTATEEFSKRLIVR